MSEMEYRTIRTESLGHLERKMNEAAKEGWRVISTNYILGPYWNEHTATLERASPKEAPRVGP